MMLRLTGEITRDSGMWHERIYQDGKHFILETQSEMQPDPTREEFSELESALAEMLRRT